MSIPLLLERSSPGLGPKVPLRVPFKRVVVEGLLRGCAVNLYADGTKVETFKESCHTTLQFPLLKGTIVQAEIVGEGSCVNVRLEPD